MVRPSLRFLCVLLVSAPAAYFAWRDLPIGTDRPLMDVVARSSANPPFIIGGTGSQPQPWSLRVLSPSRKADPKEVPAIVSLGDDPQGIFQSSPPSPVDIAVVLKNTRRLGADKAAISATLAWDEPDVIALSALDGELAAFSSLVTAAPVSRSATGNAIPPTFRRASIPLDQIQGDTSAIPSVNRVSLPGVILGGDSALSGFSLIEQDTSTNAPLIARWEDRAVFAFPLVAVLASKGIPVESLEIQLGNYIKLGPNGPVIPIDAFGRMAVAAGNVEEAVRVAADAVIDSEQSLPRNGSGFILLRDDQSGAEEATRAFSRKVAPLIAAISSGAGMTPEQTFRRLGERWDLGILGGIVFVLSLMATATRFGRHIGFGILAAVTVVAHFALAGFASIWLPTLPILAAVIAAFFPCFLFFREKSHSKVAVTASTTPKILAEEISAAAPIPDPVDESPAPGPTPDPKEAESTEEEAPVAAKKTAAKKAAAKNVPAKKAAAKKTPAKKTASKKASGKKSASPRKKPPGES